MLPSYPPLEAYRRDIARLAPGGSFGPDDGEWIAASLVLQRYVDAAAGERQHLAPELAAFLAGGDELTICTAGLQFAFHIEKLGAIHLSATWLSLLERLVPRAQIVQHGRILTHRARLLRKLGDGVASRALYEELERLGQTTAEPELTARAWLGYAVLAQMHGNYPEARRWYNAAALVADDNGCIEPAFTAHIGLLGCATMAKDFDRGVTEGWRAFELSENSSEREAEVLNNLAQLLHEAGAYRASLRAFAAVVARTQYPDVYLPALGGTAMSAAILGIGSVVSAVSVRIEGAGGVGWSYPFAAALMELSDAHTILGLAARAEEYRDRAMRIADERGFHEISHRARHPSTPPREDAARVSLGPAALRIASDIERLDAPADLCAVG